jgi:hypothetical protein
MLLCISCITYAVFNISIIQLAGWAILNQSLKCLSNDEVSQNDRFRVSGIVSVGLQASSMCTKKYTCSEASVTALQIRANLSYCTEMKVPSMMYLYPSLDKALGKVDSKPQNL